MDLISRILLESEEEDLFKPRRVEQRQEEIKLQKIKKVKEGFKKYGKDKFRDIWVIEMPRLTNMVYLVRNKKKEKALEYFELKKLPYGNLEKNIKPLLEDVNALDAVMWRMEYKHDPTISLLNKKISIMSISYPTNDY